MSSTRRSPDEPRPRDGAAGSPRAAPDPGRITVLLHRWRLGDEAAEQELWPMVYGEMRRLARSVLRQRGRRRVGTETLVHEAYLRLVGSDAEVDWSERGHFYAVASRAMRFVLVDDARRRLAKKREAEDSRAELPRGAIDPGAHAAEDVIAVHQVLGRLAKVNPRHEKLVEMRYFAGMSIEETAEALQVSRPTVVRDWKAVRSWLYAELAAAPAAGEGRAERGDALAGL
ncbi:MAG: ECF-type sigma factor [Holophagales bacterium]|nr:ECF-type sigma factor [Holophagales bacterium]